MILTDADRRRLDARRSFRETELSQMRDAAANLAIAVRLWDDHGRTGDFGMTEDLAAYRRASRRLELRVALDRIKYAAVTQ